MNYPAAKLWSIRRTVDSKRPFGWVLKSGWSTCCGEKRGAIEYGVALVKESGLFLKNAATS